jgi:hypothetical protein
MAFEMDLGEISCKDVKWLRIRSITVSSGSEWLYQLLHGRLHHGVCSLVRNSVRFSKDLLGFYCGIWLQDLLTL